MKKRFKELERKYANHHDDRNPIFMFQGTHTELLAAIARGEVNPTQLAMMELMNRGYDINGKWIGFDAAEKYWNERK